MGKSFDTDKMVEKELDMISEKGEKFGAVLAVFFASWRKTCWQF